MTPSKNFGLTGYRPVALYYADSSALAKLILPEPETEALSSLLSNNNVVVTSALSRTEVLRGVRRIAADADAMIATRRVFGRVIFIDADERLLESAGVLDPPTLRSLDAIHVATALSVVAELDSLITYDRRMAEAASRFGLTVLAPGRPDNADGS